MFSVGSQWLTGQPYKTVSEIADRYQSLTLDEVNGAISDHPLTTNTTLVVGPREDLQPVNIA